MPDKKVSDRFGRNQGVGAAGQVARFNGPGGFGRVKRVSAPDFFVIIGVCNSGQSGLPIRLLRQSITANEWSTMNVSVSVYVNGRRCVPLPAPAAAALSVEIR